MDVIFIMMMAEPSTIQARLPLCRLSSGLFKTEILITNMKHFTLFLESDDNEGGSAQEIECPEGKQGESFKSFVEKIVET